MSIKQRIFPNVLTTFCEHIIYKYIGIVVNMFMLSFIFVIVFGLIAGNRIWAGFFLSFVYICIAVGDPVIKKRGGL
jgi:hypothetical protein